jgi:serine/threonine protein kinase/Tol biopolymer transport system component
VSLAPGTRLGPYEVLTQIGAGGMGEVYKATDTNLKRSVAIKVLPALVAGDAERLARFQREAEVLAALNHPNIAAIYGLERSGDTTALVMELVEGPTLADRIAQGAIPIDEALAVAKQIAEALEAAHEQGIVHRDLKPANIKVRDDGTVKVLDFGLAKAMEPAGTLSPGLSQSPTITTPAMTQAGLILGTAAYMSPEQAKGKPADKRSDIWAFGCVLFEMLTGKRAFEGEDVSDTLTTVLKGEPDWNALPADVPESIRGLLHGCFEKGRKQRVGDISTALFIMRRPAIASLGSTAPDPSTTRWRRILPAALTAIVTAAVVGGIAWSRKPATVPATVMRFADALPEGSQITERILPQIAISRDGTQIVYGANHRFYLRSISENAARAIPGSEVAVSDNIGSPLFAPDGRSIVYWTRRAQNATTIGTLKRMPVTGGTAVTLAEVDYPLGMSWYGETVLIAQRQGGIVRVPASGGTPDTLVRLGGGEIPASPQMLPDGDAVLFTLGRASPQQQGLAVAEWEKTAQIVVQSLTSGQRSVIVEGASVPRYLPTGHLVFAVGGVMFAAPFDVRRQAVTGPRVAVVEGILRVTAGSLVGGLQADVSDTGSLVYVSGPAALSSPERNLVIVDRNGTVEPLKLGAGAYGRPRVSPDGRQVTFQTDDGRRANVWIFDVSGSSPPRQLTFTGSNHAPIWTADGKRVTFQSDRDGDAAIYWQPADGTVPAERLNDPERAASQRPESWSPDGQHLLFTKQVGSAITLWQLSLADRKASLFGDVQGQIGVSLIDATFSPDGRWVAYALPAPSRAALQLFVQPFPSTGARYLVAAHSDSPSWSPTGKELFFLDLLGSGMMAASVSTGSAFAVGNPAPLPPNVSNILRGTRTGPGTSREFDVFPDGHRFVAAVPAREAGVADTAAREIHIVLNWFEELKQRVPAK